MKLIRDDAGPTISRRALMRLAGGAAAFSTTRSFALVSGTVQAQERGVGAELDWRPIFFDRTEAVAVARLTEVILPRTDTPGAIDADVPSYVDLVISLEKDSVQMRFREHLRALEERCRRDHDGRGLSAVSAEELNRLLSTISDEVTGLSADDRGLQSLFKDLKRHTIVGYYTSLEGRTEELGLPARVQRVQWQGCSSAADHRSAG